MNDIISAAQQLHTAAAPRHQHDSWEMLYCTQGACSLVFEASTLPCGAGDMVIIPPDMPHSLVNQGEAECFHLHIADAALALRQATVLHDDENRSLLHVFEDTHYLYHSGEAHRSALLPAYGQLLSQHVSCRSSSSPRSQVVEEIAQSIMQNYANPNYELDELLRSAPYCYDYLCRLFRQEMHTTPHKYLANLRLQTAADILRAGGSSITEAARMCGYHDPLYFSRMFKKKFGVSPREYGKNGQ